MKNMLILQHNFAMLDFETADWINFRRKISILTTLLMCMFLSHSRSSLHPPFLARHAFVGTNRRTIILPWCSGRDSIGERLGWAIGHA